MTILTNTHHHSDIPHWKEALRFVGQYAQATSEIFAETLWPTRCVLCDTPGFVLCPDCCTRFFFLDWWQACPRCGAPFGRMQCTECNTITMKKLERTEPPFDACASVVIYNDDAARTVRTWKDAGERRLADEMAKLMIPLVAPDWYSEQPRVVPIPATVIAKRRRGFDHGNELACALAQRLNLSTVSLLLPPRVKDQRVLTRHERIENMRGRFRTLPGASVPPAVLLVDDVYTTGSTLFAACDALRAAGAKKIFCLTFARVL